jgi:tungstate transport system substrate-binding protein
MWRSAVAAVAVVAGAACAEGDNSPEAINVATTTSVDDSGLLDVLVPAFESANPGWSIRYMAVGSGQALELGRRGDVDAIIAHSPADEQAFMDDGHGTDRRAMMHNEFVIVGPPSDPAGIRGTRDAAVAFAAIAAMGLPFVSRGDDSGTHRRERSVWLAAGTDPAGDWYAEAGVGMADALGIAAEREAYTLTDIASFLYARDRLALEILSSGDERLVNRYSAILVANALQSEGALMFADWLTGEVAQRLIGEFGIDRFGRPLFVPDAAAQPAGR